MKIKVVEVRDYQRGATSEIATLNMLLAIAKRTGLKVFCNYRVSNPYRILTMNDFLKEIEEAKDDLDT